MLVCYSNCDEAGHNAPQPTMCHKQYFTIEVLVTRRDARCRPAEWLQGNGILLVLRLTCNILKPVSTGGITARITHQMKFLAQRSVNCQNETRIIRKTSIK